MSSVVLGNVAPSVCSYGLVGPECVFTYSDFNKTAYITARYIYLSFGIVGFLASSIRYIQAVRTKASSLEKYSYIGAIFCSMTFFGRCADPISFGGLMPRMGNFLFSELCTASIYSVLVCSVCSWMSIAGVSSLKQKHVTLTNYGMNFVVWMYYAGFDVVALDSKGFYRFDKMYRYFGDALLLASILFLILYYGWQVLQRVYEVQKMEGLGIPMTPTDSPTCAVDGERNDHYTQSQAAISCQQTVIEQKPLARFEQMKRLLYVITTASVVAITLQIYTLVVSSKSVEESDATICSTNGSTCRYLSASVPLLHYAQFLAICCIVFGYSRTLVAAPLNKIDETLTDRKSRHVV